ncbi:MAG: cell division protein FtsL [Paracoccaceae bacterium]
MRSLFYVLTALAVMGMAHWAYRENYRNQRAIKQVSDLQAEIGELREALAIQRAEWAYLNRPDRLRELADLNFDRLGLLPMQADHFAQMRELARPAAFAPLPISQPIDVVGEREAGQ